jgi:hypothetical protein
MITEWYNTDAIVWRTQLLCVCRLVSGEQTKVVSNSYATQYSVRSSLRKTLKDLWVHLVHWCMPLLETSTLMTSQGLPFEVMVGCTILGFLRSHSINAHLNISSLIRDNWTLAGNLHSKAVATTLVSCVCGYHNYSKLN